MSFSGKYMQKQLSAHDNSGRCQLSKEQVDYYWDNGYLIIEQLYDVPMLNIFRERFAHICAKPSVAKLYSIVKDPTLCKQNANPEMYINKVQEILYDQIYMKYSEDPRLLQILTQLIGEDITAVNCMLINKPPGTRTHPTHQDLYYLPLRPADKIVGVWTAVDRAHQNNGCLYVIPGSHKEDRLYHHCEQAKEFRKAMTAHYANSACQYIDVTGTTQEYLAKSVEQELKKRGGDYIAFVDFWRMKCKQVKGVRSHL